MLNNRLNPFPHLLVCLCLSLRLCCRLSRFCFKLGLILRSRIVERVLIQALFQRTDAGICLTEYVRGVLLLLAGNLGEILVNGLGNFVESRLLLHPSRSIRISTLKRNRCLLSTVQPGIGKPHIRHRFLYLTPIDKLLNRIRVISRFVLVGDISLGIFHALDYRSGRRIDCAVQIIDPAVGVVPHTLRLLLAVLLVFVD